MEQVRGPDMAIFRAETLGDDLCPPQQEFIRRLQRERDAWLVGSAASGAYPAPVLAKSAGFRTLSAYRSALSRARARVLSDDEAAFAAEEGEND